MSTPQIVELLVSGVAIGCIYSLIALGFTLIMRSTGVLNFAQGETVMLGAMFGLSVFCLIPLPFRRTGRAPALYQETFRRPGQQQMREGRAW